MGFVITNAIVHDGIYCLTNSCTDYSCEQPQGCLYVCEEGGVYHNNLTNEQQCYLRYGESYGVVRGTRTAALLDNLMLSSLLMFFAVWIQRKLYPD